MSETGRDADVAFIEALARLVRESELSEIEVKREYGEDDSLRVRVSKHAPVQPQAPATPAPAMPQPASAPAAASPAPSETPAAPPASADPASHPGAVTSPMVGTVYLSPEPGSAAFAAVGDTVKEGQTLLIVEAMKTMNHIPAPASGKVVRVLVEDGAPVEYGAPLMIVE